MQASYSFIHIFWRTYLSENVCNMFHIAIVICSILVDVYIISPYTLGILTSEGHTHYI